MSPTTNILDKLADSYGDFSPQLRQAAQYVLDNPNEIGVNSMRAVATAAEVNPNTLVRMAKTLGFEGYESFREPFRVVLRDGVVNFPDRARWLQSVTRGKRHGKLYGEMAATSLSNIEELFSNISADEVKQAAGLIVKSKNTYIFGVGSCYALAHNFWYIARMAFDHLVLVPRHGSLPIDDIARIGKQDVLLAMTFDPYRREVVNAVHVARERGAKIVSLTDSRASPIALKADHVFVVSTETPQFFPSLLASGALLESLTAFMVADAGAKVVSKIEDFHRARYESDVYCTAT